MIVSVVPYEGPRQGHLYVPPPIMWQNYQPLLENDKQASDLQESAELDGVYYSTGTAPSWTADAIYSIESRLFPNWLIANGYPIGAVGVEQARQDFIAHIVLGGLLKINSLPVGNFQIWDDYGRRVRVISAVATGKFNGSSGSGSYNEQWDDIDNVTLKYALAVSAGNVTLQTTSGPCIRPMAL